MARVFYTAKRSLVRGHVEGNEYEIEFRADAQRSRSVQRTPQTSLSGKRETTYFRGDATWEVRTAMLNGATLPTLLQMREFLDSVESGETFTFDPYLQPRSFVTDPQIDLSAIGDVDTPYWNLTLSAANSVRIRGDGGLAPASWLNSSKSIRFQPDPGFNSRAMTVATLPATVGQIVLLDFWYLLSSDYVSDSIRATVAQLDGAGVELSLLGTALDQTVRGKFQHQQLQFTITEATAAGVHVGFRQVNGTVGFASIDNVTSHLVSGATADEVNVQLQSTSYDEARESQTEWQRVAFTVIEV